MLTEQLWQGEHSVGVGVGTENLLLGTPCSQGMWQLAGLDLPLVQAHQHIPQAPTGYGGNIRVSNSRPLPLTCISI